MNLWAINPSSSTFFNLVLLKFIVKISDVNNKDERPLSLVKNIHILLWAGLTCG